MRRILYQLERREHIPELDREIRVVKPRKYFVKDSSKSFHTEFGEVKPEKIAKSRFKFKGKDFVSIEPSFLDIYSRLTKGAQTVPPKDIGTILVNTGITKDSVIVDAGAGSGGMAIMLANFCKKVIAYEIRDDFFETVKKNIDFMDVKNVDLKKGDVYKKIDERDVDVVTFDLPEPWKALPQAKKALKMGGYLVVYNPSIPQIMDTQEAIRDSKDFLMLRIVEIIEREWEFDKRKVRPRSKSNIHSGFLLFARKIK